MGQYFNDFQGETLSQAPANTQLEWGSGNFVASIVNDSGTKVLSLTRDTSGTSGNEQHLAFLRPPTAQLYGRSLTKFRINTNPNTGANHYPLTIMTEVKGTASNMTFLAWNVWARGDLNVFRITLDRRVDQAYVWIAQSAEFTLTQGTWYWIRTENVAYTGSAQNDRVRVWQDGTTEPSTWDIDFDHSANAVNLITTGLFGLGPYSFNENVSIAQFGVGWAGDPAPSSMPAQYLGDTSGNTISSDSSLTATGVIVPGVGNYGSKIKQTVKKLSTGYVNTDTISVTGVSQGDFLLLANKSGGALTSVTDSSGQTWTSVASIGASGNILNVWQLPNANAGTHNITMSGSGYYVYSTIVREYTGMATTAAIDVLATAADSGYPNTHTSANITTTNAKDRLVLLYGGSGAAAGTNATFTANSGFANVDWVSNGDYSTVAIAGKSVATTGTYGGTITSSDYETGGIVILAIKDVSVSKPAPPGATSYSNWYAYGVPAVSSYSTRTTYLQNAWNKFVAYTFTQTGMPTGMPTGAWRVQVPDQTDPVANTTGGTFSEGIGYGMLAAVYMGQSANPVYDSNAKAYFDGLWTYYKFFKDSNGLMNWRISAAGNITGTGGATDGDIDVAMALVMADKTWRSNGTIDYQTEAKTLLAAIQAKEFYGTATGFSNIMLNGDTWDTTQSGTPNWVMPDYFAPGFYSVFATYTGDARWNTIKSVNYPIMSDYYESTYGTGLLPDNATRQGTAVSGQNFKQGYNALRRWRQVLDYLWNGGSTYSSTYWLNAELVSLIQGVSNGVPTATNAEYAIDGTSPAGYSNVAHNQSYATATLVSEGYSYFGNTLYAYLDNQITTQTASSIGYFGLGLALMSQLVGSGLMQPTYAGPAVTFTGTMTDGGDSTLVTGASILIAGAVLDGGDSSMVTSGNRVVSGDNNGAPMFSTSELYTSFVSSGAAISQTTQNSSQTVGWAAAGTKGDQEFFVMAQSFAAPSTITGVALITYGVGTTQTFSVTLYNNYSDANSNINAVTSQNITLQNNYSGGVGTPTWYDWIFPSPVSGSGTMFFVVRCTNTNTGAQAGSQFYFQNSNIYSGGSAYFSDTLGSTNLAQGPTTYNGASIPDSDLAFKVYGPQATIGDAATLDGDSQLTASGQKVSFGTMSDSGDSALTANALITYSGTMTNTADSTLLSTGTIFGSVSDGGDSSLSASANVGVFSSLNDGGDSSLLINGSYVPFVTFANNGDSNLTATGTIFSSMSDGGDSSLTASAYIGIFASMNNTADSTLIATPTIFGIMTNSSDSTMVTGGSYIGIGTVNDGGDSTLSAIGNASFYVSMNNDSDSSMNVVGSYQFYGTLSDFGDSTLWPVDSQRTAITSAILGGDSSVAVADIGTLITHTAITKEYLYKIYDRNWNFLGIWDDVISEFGYSQEVNSAGAQISVTLARNADTLVQTYDFLADDTGAALITDDGNTLAAETKTTNSVGSGTTVDLNLNVKIYEFSSSTGQSLDGDLIFTGFVSMYTSRYGSNENTDVSVFSYGSDLDNWVLQDALKNTRVSYLSKDPSVMLKDSLDKFQSAGGLIYYDNTTLENTYTYTGGPTNYTFNLNTELEVIKQCLVMAPSYWFFYADLATNLLHFHPAPTTPSHYFTLGKHVTSLDLEKTIEGVVNEIYYTGGTPVNISLDRFNDTAGVQLENHVGEIGSTWIRHPGSTATAQAYITDANRIRQAVANQEGMWMTTTPTPSSDALISVDYYIASNVGDISVMGRLDPTSNTHYLARLLPTNGGTVELYKRIAGTYTLLQSQQLPADKLLISGQTRHFEFKMEGAQLTLSVDGTAYVDLEDRSIIFGNRAGIRTAGNIDNTNTTGMHMDNFTVTALKTTTQVPLFRHYTDNNSIGAYRRGLARVQDSRVTLTTSADLIASTQISQNNSPRYRSNITIAAQAYDIRSIKLGQLIAFRNFGNFIDDLQMQIVRLDYKPDSVVVHLDTLMPSVPKRLEDIKRNLNQAEVVDNPDAPALITIT